MSRCSFLLAVMVGMAMSGVEGADCSGYSCLKEYVDKEDGAYSWTDTGHRLVVDPSSNGRGGWTGYYLNFTSQRWMTPEQVSRSEWWHILVVIIPDNLTSTDTTMLWMTDGDNHGDFQPDLSDYNLLAAGEIAAANGVVTSSLFQIPNQCIVYADDPDQKCRSEDANIAFTWWKIASDPTTDPSIILQLPMAKAGVKALDTVENFLTSASAPEEVKALGLTPTHHVVGGASKRGWNTWLVGAVDPRVIGIVPIVMDELNFMENIKHHYRSLGGWSFALEDYWKMNLTMYFGDPDFKAAFDIIDPFSFKEMLGLPKLVCNSADDEFFLPDNIRYWWKEMPDYQRMNRFITLPFSDHTTIPGTIEVLGAVNTWLREMLGASGRLGPRPAATTIQERNEASVRLVEAADLPVYNWTISSTGETITVMADRKPTKVTMWHSSTCHAHANTRKDFRLMNDDSPCTCGVPLLGHCLNLAVLWAPTELEETSPGSLTWVATMPAPTGGQWTAFFIDLQFDGPKPPADNERGYPFGQDGVFEFTSAISIVPDTFPAEDCTGAECMGSLV